MEWYLISMHNTKIVATLGPATSSEPIIRQLLLAGVDVFRLNASHGTPAERTGRIAAIRQACAESGRRAAILLDLQGPKIRLGRFADGGCTLKPGGIFTITTEPITGDCQRAATTYTGLAGDVKPGDRVLLADGAIELRVLSADGASVRTEVVCGGPIGDHKGINLPGVAVNLPSLMDKDRDDLQFGVSQGVDMVALSFVRTAADVRQLREALQPHPLTVLAKIEKPQAWDNIDSILEEADGVMVARGDLGVEVAPEKVPLIQKRVIRRAFEFRRPVITATQMLESMIENPRPTRAEASDVANAIFDGTDAVMLSGESAVGKYPREAVEMMARIVTEAESHPASPPPRHHERLSIAETICEAMAHAARDLNIRAIAVFTETATTARLLSKYRPAAAIYAFTPYERVCNRMNLLWGVRPVSSPAELSMERMAEFAEAELARMGVLSAGDTFGLIAGTTQSAGATNFLRLIKARRWP